MAEIKEIEWQDFEFFLDGVPVTKVQGFKYKVSQETEHLYAAGSKPIGIQRGNLVYEGEIKVLKGVIDALNRAAQAAGYDDLLGPEYTLIHSFKQRGVRTRQTDTLVGVVFSEYEKGMEQNAKNMPVTLPFKYMDILSA